MKRTQMQVDESTHELLRRRAFERGVSMSALLREILQAYLAPAGAHADMQDFTFVGSGHSRQEAPRPVSEAHDDALAEAFRE